MNISLIGIGLMGQALGEHLLAENHTLTVFNRSPEKLEVEIVKIENRKERRKQLFFEPKNFLFSAQFTLTLKGSTIKC